MVYFEDDNATLAFAKNTNNIMGKPKYYFKGVIKNEKGNYFND